MCFMSGSSSMALCARNAHITVYDVTTWSWVNLVNPATWEEGKVAWYPPFAHARTSPIMDKLHVVVIRRTTKLDIRLAVWQLCLRGDGFHYLRHKGWHDKDYATTTAGSTVTVLVVANKRQSLVGIRLYHRRYIWPHPAALLSTWNLPFQYNKERTWALYQSPHF